MSEQRQLFKSAVFVVLQNDAGEYLLQERINTGYMDDHYDLSATGHVEPNESIIDAVIREAKEEIGVIIQPEDLQLVMNTQMNDSENYLNFIFESRKWEGVPKVCEPDKCGNLAWFTENNLPRRVTPTVRLFMDRKPGGSNVVYEYVDTARLAQLMGEGND